MGLPSYAHLRARDSSASSPSTAAPKWVQYLPLLILLPLVSNPLDKIFPKPTPTFIVHGLEQCATIRSPVRSADKGRTVSDRFVEGTPAVLLTNGTLWTGNEAGSEIITGGSVWFENGLIKAISKDKDELVRAMTKGRKSSKPDWEETNLQGAWVTPGIVDMHSHLGVGPSPGLRGNEETNSVKAPILPFLRSLDGLSSHDSAYNLSISGGLTTALILPGSANNIGGQAFVIKPRQTAENTPSSMVVENPFVIDEENGGIRRTGYMRHMKHACGENIKGVYNDNRFDQAYSFRKAYLAATKLREKQDAWCARGSDNKEEFPDDLEWEALADVLRGRVAVNVHCYQTVDFDQLIRLTNEFKFSIAAVHHAHEAYLVPDLLKKAYGNIPTAAIFATNKNYKTEASRGSEFAAAILASEGIPVAMKSDHPVLDSRYLPFEAQQAHHFGLDWNLALASVTSTPAKALHMDHRIGYLRPSYDADVVVWDAHPLTLGATPKQVYIDGIAQLDRPYFNPPKPAKLQKAPVSPSFGNEAEIHRQSRGDPDYFALLREQQDLGEGDIVFVGVKDVFLRAGGEIRPQAANKAGENVVVVKGGQVVCAGGRESCAGLLDEGIKVVDLKGGSVVPGLVSFGSPLGLVEIIAEKTTQDGEIADSLKQATIVALQDQLIRAADGASFGTKDALIAARSGVTRGVSAPRSSSLVSGLSFSFSTSAFSPISKGAILQEVTALHAEVSHDISSHYSISTQIGILRAHLLGQRDDSEGYWRKAAQGDIPLVIRTDKADIIARLLFLKKQVEETSHGHKKMRLVIAGGAEAHLIADEIAAAEVGVILSPARSYPTGWDQRRVLTGPPLTAQTPIEALVSSGVTVALGILESWSARNTRLEAAWARLSAPSLTDEGALALVSSNLEKLLGVEKRSVEAERADWVAYEGDFWGFEGKAVCQGMGALA